MIKVNKKLKLLEWETTSIRSGYVLNVMEWNEATDSKVIY